MLNLRNEDQNDAISVLLRLAERLAERLACISTRTWKDYSYEHIKHMADGEHSLLRV